MAIALSHGGPTVFEAETPSREVLVGTAKGIATIARDGDGWKVAGHVLEDKHISAILVEPVSGAIFAGAYKDGSLHASFDGGKTWERRDTGLAESDIYSLEATQIDGHTRLFCGTEPARLFFSDDLGQSWAEMPELRSVPTVDSWSFPGPPHVAHAKHITFDPRDSQTMYVSIEVGGLLRSRDGGKTFEDVPGMYEDVHRLVINPADPKRMYVPGGNGLYMSNDEGDNWTHVLNTEDEIGGYPDQLVMHPSNPDLMFIAAAKDSPGLWRTTHFAGARVSRSTDGGRTWEVLTHGLPDRMQGNIEAMSLEAHGESCSLLAATTAGEIYASDDSGETWSLVITDLAPISKGGHFVPLMAGAATVSH